MTNRKIIEKVLNNNGYIIGCWNSNMEKLSTRSINKVINMLNTYTDTDIHVTVNKIKYIVEVSSCDNEVDFNVITLKEYNNIYCA